MMEWPDGWEVVERRTNRKTLHLLLMLLQAVLTMQPLTFSSVTYVVREKSTGTLRRVTARSEAAAAAKIAAGAFDRADPG